MPGIKLFDPFSRKAGISLADFSHHWITHHGELVKGFRRITRYVQSIRLDSHADELGPPFASAPWDGCAETWHADPASVVAMVDEPRFPELMEDERNFLDLTRPRHLIQTEELLLDEHDFDPRTRGVKVLVFARRDPALTQEQFADAWEETARGAVTLGRQLGVTRHLLCTAVGHVRRDAEAELERAEPAAASADDRYDGVRELWWPDVRSLEAGLATHSDAARRLLRPECVDVGRSSTLVAHERIIVA